MLRPSIQADGSLPAVGKPSFACFSVDYLPDDACLSSRANGLARTKSPQAASYERSEDTGTNRRNLRIGAVRLALVKTDSFHILLLSQQIFGCERPPIDPDHGQLRRSARIVAWHLGHLGEQSADNCQAKEDFSIIASMKVGNASVRVARTTISACCFALSPLLLSIIQPASGFGATIHHRRRSNPPIIMSSAGGPTEDQPMADVAAKSGDASFSNFSRTNNIPTFDGDEKAKATDFANYFCAYSQLYHQKQMLTDHNRMAAYHAAIMGNADIFKDKVVMDVGTGSGILAVWAAQAGAKRVYAIEYTDMAKHARRVVKSNGLEDVVTVIQGAVEEVILPEEDWEQFSLSREEGDDEEIVDGKKSQRVVDIILSGERECHTVH
ncbi:hypothetical protein THAOC_03858 [Thalassiosira oceanica]|uniref:Methyltransferase domain-containing protein n=1 Tax=Thalassiosira oceanica TaxID=159749 RepID=K0T6N0_THAOC|nr:hypothetical protein THAOC_03858 [Thalassiosira oceanica]|eukprot:EJK74463.1 hypothetical protein THAOC_03858 [Thalassiosira oceanica]